MEGDLGAVDSLDGARKGLEPSRLSPLAPETGYTVLHQGHIFTDPIDLTL
jgi:hypothetical protein